MTTIEPEDVERVGTKRRASRAWHEKNREASRAKAKAWRSAKPGWSRDYYRKYKRRAGVKAKLRARGAVKRALARRILVRPSACERCGTEGRVQAHHADYRRPLEVTWICRTCHGQEHRRW